MDIKIDYIVDALSSFIDYIENFIVDSKEKETALIKLKEAVFWLTYLNEMED